MYSFLYIGTGLKVEGKVKNLGERERSELSIAEHWQLGKENGWPWTLIYVLF